MQSRMLSMLAVGVLVFPTDLWAQAPNPPEPVGRRYALVIGVRDYLPDQFYSLPFAERDAVEFAQVLEDAGYVVTLMTQTRSAEPGLGSFAPYHSFIEEQLDQLLEMDLSEEDTVIIAFAGHGIQLTAAADGDESPHFFFCPADAKQRIDDRLLTQVDQLDDQNRLISLSSIYERLEQSRAGKKLLLADVCRTVPGSRSSAETFPRLPPPEGGVAAFYSCSENERAWESTRLRHGVFFHSVIEGLKGAADAGTRTRPADGVISLNELQAFVVPNVRDYMLANASEFQGATQKPELHGSIQGEFRILEVVDREETPTPPTAPMNPLSESSPWVASEAGEIHELEELPGFRMAWIPPGRFTMGSPRSETGRYPNEEQVQVELTRGYWLGVTEVTQAQWKAVMDTEPWKTRDFVQEGADYPAIYVSWEEATEFCEVLTNRERAANRLASNERYALPTEAQWEFAYRAGSQTAYYWGNDSRNLDDYAWFRARFAHRVGQKLENAWGLHDMSGNVWEWCSDWYGEELFGGADPIGTDSGSERCYRGGSWDEADVRALRGACRGRRPPTNKYYLMGFRIARVVEQ